MTNGNKVHYNNPIIIALNKDRTSQWFGWVC